MFSCVRKRRDDATLACNFTWLSLDQLSTFSTTEPARYLCCAPALTQFAIPCITVLQEAPCRTTVETV